MIDQARVSEDNRLITSQCGSPLYMAPEIVFGNGYTNKVDVWSVGVIFYGTSLPSSLYVSLTNDRAYRRPATFCAELS